MTQKNGMKLVSILVFELNGSWNTYRSVPLCVKIRARKKDLTGEKLSVMYVTVFLRASSHFIIITSSRLGTKKRERMPKHK